MPTFIIQRLSEYKYCDRDAVIASALERCQAELG